MINQKKDITAIIVLYNVTDVIFECLDNLNDTKIIIADNGDNDPNIIEKIKKKANIIKYFKFKKNIGFGRACNFCLRHVKTKFTLLIEPDVFIKEKDLIYLKESFSKYSEAGILVPTLINENDDIIDELHNLPELNISNQNQTNNYFNGDTCVHFCWAAVLLLNTDLIKKVGLFNKKIFIFWEDFYLCRKLKEKKIQIIKIYNSRAFHKENASTKKTIKTKFILYKHHILSSYIYFNVNKKDALLKKKFFIYLFRVISYFLILNLEKSLKNLGRLCATITYLNQK